MDFATLEVLGTFLEFNKSMALAGGMVYNLDDLINKNAAEFVLGSMDQNDLHFIKNQEESDKKAAVNQILNHLNISLDELRGMSLFDMLQKCVDNNIQMKKYGDTRPAAKEKMAIDNANSADEDFLKELREIGNDEDSKQDAKKGCDVVDADFEVTEMKTAARYKSSNTDSWKWIRRYKQAENDKKYNEMVDYTNSPEGQANF